MDEPIDLFEHYRLRFSKLREESLIAYFNQISDPESRIEAQEFLKVFLNSFELSYFYRSENMAKITSTLENNEIVFKFFLDATNRLYVTLMDERYGSLDALLDCAIRSYINSTMISLSLFSEERKASLTSIGPSKIRELPTIFHTIYLWKFFL